MDTSSQQQQQLEFYGCVGRLCPPPHHNTTTTAAAVPVHLLPCCIAHNGDAPVSDFFKPKPTDLNADGLEVKEAAFRGRKLLGCTLHIPPEYCGFVLEKDPNNVNSVVSHRGGSNGDEDIDLWRTRALFHDITYWNHDITPSSADPLRRCHEWLNLSSSIHKSVSADEVLAFLQDNPNISSGNFLQAK
ncbi:hypothetical protein O6H91_06G063800 [Diphasiastrum complanatum]|uniref:Uncharacterized protein n=1 Tax=Diphasiastrum complanatum TaxID=34168 RepID=A0ACC2DER5_DIPCM|nr:hypothetical protein O6H91_06G063800 [Diphasiastrum complanatum]